MAGLHPDPPRYDTGDSARAATWLAALLFASVLPLLFAALFEWPYYRRYVWFWEMADSTWDRALISWLLWWKSLYVIWPALTVSGLLIWRHRRRRAATFLVSASVLVIFWLAVDLQVQRQFGNHAFDFLPYLKDVLLQSPGANHLVWAGNAAGMTGQALLLLAAAAAAGWVGWLACRWLAAALLRRVAGPARRRALWAATLAALLLLVTYPPLQATLARPMLLRAAKDALPVDVSPADRLFRVESLRRALASGPPRGVQIVSLLPNAAGADFGKEQVHLHNFGHEQADLDGWRLKDAKGNDFKLRGALAPGRSRVVTLPRDAGLKLNNDGDDVELRNARNRLVHQVSYTRSDVKAGALVSFRDERGFDEFEERLDEDVRGAYARLHADVFSAPPVDAEAAVGPGRSAKKPPNVIYIVLESFRHTAVSPHVMSRLEAWGGRGLRLRRHYAGSNGSHLGLFALLYGRSPLVYDATLDGNVPPQTAYTLRRSGYESYFMTSGDCSGFRRMGEFLNGEQFDHDVLETGKDWRDWPQRDAALLERVRRAAGEPSPRPRFIVAFLMSTHYPYSFPPEFNRHQPSGDGVDRSNWNMMPTRVIHNRYKNAALYLEDRIMRLVDSLDPQRNVIVVTGDHGESMLEDGALAHCSRGSEIQTRVPFLMVGPGVPPREIAAPTTHTDVLPTLLHALAGRPVPVAHAHGRDLLQAGPLADRVLLCPYRWTDPRDLVLIDGRERLQIKVWIDQPRAKVFGFCDKAARLDLSGRHDCSPAALRRWSQAFREEMARIAR